MLDYTKLTTIELLDRKRMLESSKYVAEIDNDYERWKRVVRKLDTVILELNRRTPEQTEENT